MFVKFIFTVEAAKQGHCFFSVAKIWRQRESPMLKEEERERERNRLHIYVLLHIHMRDTQ